MKVIRALRFASTRIRRTTSFYWNQLAGDLIEPNDPSAAVATGFLGAGPWDYSGFITAIQGTAAARGTRHRDLDNMLTTVMTTTVGFTKEQCRAIGQSHHVGAPQHLRQRASAPACVPY